MNNIQVNSGLYQTKPQNVADITKYFECFNGTDGYYCFCTKPSRDRTQLWEQIFTDSMEEIYKLAYTYKNTHNCYLGQATYRTKNRGEVSKINRLYVDIDSDNNNSLNKKQCNELAVLLQEYAELPEPTIIIYTGHGLQMIWNVDDSISQKWTMYENFIHGKVKEALEDIKQNSISQLTEYLELYNVHLDSKVKDKARVLRIPGTINIKAEPVYASIIGYTGNEFTSTDINIPEPKTHRKTPKKKQINLSDSDANSQYMNEIIRPRLYDFEKLINLRNEKGVVSGYRNTLISMVVGTCCSLGYSKEQTLEISKSFNNSFLKPLQEAEIKSWIKTSYRLRNVGNEYKRGCKWKTSTIIQLLEISTAEQKQMEVLKYSSESKRENKRQQKQERNQKIMELKNKGWSNTMIADKLKIHRNTVAKVIKKLGQSCTKNAPIKRGFYT